MTISCKRPPAVNPLNWSFIYHNRPFAQGHHFTTTTRILQGFAFLRKLGILGLQNLNMKGKTKFQKDSGRSSNMTPPGKWPVYS